MNKCVVIREERELNMTGDTYASRDALVLVLVLARTKIWIRMWIMGMWSVFSSPSRVSADCDATCADVRIAAAAEHDARVEGEGEPNSI